MSDKTALEWTEAIEKITAELKSKYSAIPKFIEEMPVTLSADGTPDNDPRHLKAYYESLEAMLKNYNGLHESSDFKPKI